MEQDRRRFECADYMFAPFALNLEVDDVAELCMSTTSNLAPSFFLAILLQLQHHTSRSSTSPQSKQRLSIMSSSIFASLRIRSAVTARSTFLARIASIRRHHAPTFTDKGSPYTKALTQAPPTAPSQTTPKLPPAPAPNLTPPPSKASRSRAAVTTPAPPSWAAAQPRPLAERATRPTRARRVATRRSRTRT